MDSDLIRVMAATAIPLVIVAIVLMIITYRAGRDTGSQQGFEAGHRAGWIERHDEATEEERAAWRERNVSDYDRRTINGHGTSSPPA